MAVTTGDVVSSSKERNLEGGWPAILQEDVQATSTAITEFAETEVFPITEIPTLDEMQAVFAGLTSGGFVAVWNGIDGYNDFGVKAEIFDNNGRRTVAEFLVNTNTAGVQADADVAALADGGFVVVWTDESTYPNVFDIKLQRFDAGGHRVGPEKLVNSTVEGFQVDPHVVALAGGGFSVTWQQQNDYSPDDVRTQLFDADGKRIGGERLVTSNGTPGAVTALADGGYVVSWMGFDSDYSRGVKAQIYDSKGGKTGTPINLNSYVQGAQTRAVIAGLPSGGFVAAWSDDGNNFGKETGHQGTWFQRFDANGKETGSPVRIFPQPGEPELSILQDGTVLMTWAGPYGTTDFGLFGVRMNANGQVLQPPFSINPLGTSVRPQSTITALQNGAFAVGWLDRARVYFPIVEGDDSANMFKGTSGRDFYRGHGGNDKISGGAEDDNLSGGAGNDVLVGGVGADYMQGGLGDDIYYVDNAGDVVFEANGQGYDSVLSSVNFSLAGSYAEALTLTGTEAIKAVGNDLDNNLSGNSADNILNGGRGADKMAGRNGNDTYYVDNAGDIVIEQAAQGDDTVRSTITYTLPDNVEYLVLAGDSAIKGVGNARANRITGNSAEIGRAHV